MKIFTAVCLALLIAAPASAQPTNGASAPDPAKLQLARQYVEATGGAKQAQAQSKALYDAMFQGMAKGAPAGGEAHLAKLRGEVEEMTRSLLPAMMDNMAEVFADNFSAQELRDLIAFTKSSTGQAMIRKMPAVNTQLIARTMPLVAAEMPKMATRMVDDLCADTQCTAEQKSTMLANMTRQFAPSGGR